MPKKQHKRQDRALSISIRGNGLTIDAKINHTRLGDVLADVVQRVAPTVTTPPPTTAPSPEHDFDVVKRVIENAEPKVLEAFMTLAKQALERHNNAS